MFSKPITETPLTTPVADSYFQHVRGEPYRRDISFLATLRAIVAPRMSEGDKISLEFRESNYTLNDIENHGGKRVADAVVGNFHALGYDGWITVENFVNTSENNCGVMDVTSEYIVSDFGDWEVLQKVTDFFRKSFYVICLVNRNKRSVVLLCDNLSMQKLHYLQCGISVYLPWYFNPEDGFSDLEMELINSFREKSLEPYLECLGKIAEQYDFRTMFIRQQLNGFESRADRERCASLKIEITGIMDEVNNWNNRIGERLKEKDEKEALLIGLQTRLAGASEEDSEIMDYFIRNKNLHLDRVSDDGVIYFTCSGYLEYFDEDQAEKYIDNENSYIYSTHGGSISCEDMGLLMRAIFLQQTLKIKFCASYRFSLHNGVVGRGDVTYGSEFNEYMPNPHIDQYTCLGEYSRIINKILEERDYVMALEQAITSCKALAFGDYTVMEEFMKRLYGVSRSAANNRCIELPDGNVVDPKEAIKWLKEQEQIEEESNE